MNHMLHIAATTQIRLDTAGRAYYRRKLAAGQDPHGSHALPETTDLRRRLPPARRRRATARCERNETAAAGGWRGPGRALRGALTSSAADLHTRTSALRISHFPDPHTDATGRHDRLRTPSRLRLPSHAPARRSRQGGAPHRTNDLDGDKRRRTLQGAESGPLDNRGEPV